MTNPQQLIGNVSVPVSAGATAFAWLANVNELLQFVALLVAIGSGVWAWRYHRGKALEIEAECHQQALIYQQLVDMGVLEVEQSQAPIGNEATVVQANLQTYGLTLEESATNADWLSILEELVAAIVEKTRGQD